MIDFDGDYIVIQVPEADKRENIYMLAILKAALKEDVTELRKLVAEAFIGYRCNFYRSKLRDGTDDKDDILADAGIIWTVPGAEGLFSEVQIVTKSINIYGIGSRDVKAFSKLVQNRIHLVRSSGRSILSDADNLMQVVNHAQNTNQRLDIFVRPNLP